MMDNSLRFIYLTPNGMVEAKECYPGMGLYSNLTYTDKGRISADLEVSKPQLKKVAHHGAYGFWSSEDTHRFVIYIVTYTEYGKTPYRYAYNVFGLLQSISFYDSSLSAFVILEEYTYDARFNRSRTDKYILYTYDGRGRVLSETLYDSTDTMVDTILTSYSSNTVTKTYSDGLVTVTAFNFYGKTLSVQNYDDNNPSNSNTTSYTYGRDCVLLSESYYNNYTESTVTTYYTYDFRGNVASITKSTGGTVNISYDLVGRKISESDFLGHVTTYEYDNAGRLVKATMPISSTRNSVTKYYYDNAGRMTKRMQSNNPDNSATLTWSTVEYEYDGDGRLTDTKTHLTDVTAAYTHYQYNSYGLVSEVYSGMDSHYDVQMTPADYALMQYQYDNRGRQTSIEDALSQEEEYTYDNAGNLLTLTDRNGRYTVYTYDVRGNVLTESIYADIYAQNPTSVMTYTYTSTGRVHTVSDGTETVTYTYNAFGGVIVESSTTSQVKEYDYDNWSNLVAERIYLNSNLISETEYTFDEWFRLKTVNADGVTVTYWYDNNGNRVQEYNDTTNITTSYWYNYANWLTSINNYTNTYDYVYNEFTEEWEYILVLYESFSSQSISYNTDGNQRRIYEEYYYYVEYENGDISYESDADYCIKTYTYDQAGRLTSESDGTDTISYTYDAAHNRAGMTVTGTENYTTAYTYDKNNRLLTETKTVDSVDEVTTYTYDANGNTLTATTGNDVITYTYNCRDQQISWSDGTDTVTYTYNLSGLRASKTNTGVSVTVNYIWSGANMVYEYVTGFPATGIRHYYGLTLIYSSNGNFYLYNAHGDVVQLVDEDGEVLRLYKYDAFGNEKSPDPNDTNYFRYTGQYFDIESGTYYLRARYYNPVIGRFLNEDTHWNPSNMIYGDNPVKWNERQEDEKDPLGLNTYKYKPDITAIIQSNNLYIYCMDNPLMYQDANGEFAQALLWGAGAANAWNPVGWVLLGAAAVLTVATVVVVVDCASQQIKNNHKSKPPSLPSVSKVKIDMDHIMSGHGAGGNRGGPNKDRFPWEMTSPMIEKVIREAYKAAEKIGPMQTSWENGKEMVRQFFQGIVDDQIVQFWYNYTTNTIETAWWPK